MSRRALIPVFWLVLGACGRSAPTPSAPSKQQAVHPAPLPARRARKPEPTAPAPDAGPSETPEPESICNRVPFPPANYRAPHERSQQPGDGEWKRLGDPKRDRAGQGAAVMYFSVVHPHPVSKWKSVTLAAIDLCHTTLHLVAGTQEPKSKDAPEGSRVARVPLEQQGRLLAIMNGGYKTDHGHWGMMASGHEFVRPRPEGCTLAIYDDDSVRIAAWPELEASRGEMRAFRQAPPCLLSAGALHPSLEKYNERAWGGRDPKRKTRRRSAMGLDVGGRTLFYAFGEEVGPRLLALGMQAAGVGHAAQFDINYSWTRFLLVGKNPDSNRLDITSTLVPKMVYTKNGYLRRDQPRDFFYLLRRAGRD